MYELRHIPFFSYHRTHAKTPWEASTKRSDFTRFSRSLVLPRTLCGRVLRAKSNRAFRLRLSKTDLCFCFFAFFSFSFSCVCLGDLDVLLSARLTTQCGSCCVQVARPRCNRQEDRDGRQRFFFFFFFFFYNQRRIQQYISKESFFFVVCVSYVSEPETFTMTYPRKLNFSIQTR